MSKAKTHKRLSIEELKSFKGFENCTEQEAEKVIKTLETLAILFYELLAQSNTGKIISLNTETYETGQRNAA